MAQVVYIGGEATAAGFRLAGVGCPLQKCQAIFRRAAVTGEVKFGETPLRIRIAGIRQRLQGSGGARVIARGEGGFGLRDIGRCRRNRTLDCRAVAR